MKSLTAFPSRALILCAGISFLLAFSSAQAIVYDFHWPAEGSTCAGKARYVDGVFDTATDVLTIRTNFVAARATCDDNSSGQMVVPSGYMLVLNQGPFPSMYDGYCPGDVAILYFDGQNMALPRLTAYGYSGNPSSSWQRGIPTVPGAAPDKIVSSIADPSWVQSISIRDEADGSRSLDFTIDATRIKQHVPRYPSCEMTPWYGIGFERFVGIWLLPVAHTGATYGADGFLTAWSAGDYSLYDVVNYPTNEGPSCLDYMSEMTNLNVGDTFRATVYGYHSAYDTLRFTYPQLPPRTSVSIPYGSGGRPPIATDIEWTATGEDVDKTYAFEVQISDTQGRSNTCGFSVRVPSGSQEDCPLDRCGVCNGDGTSCLGCEGVDYTATLATLDTGAKKQEWIVKRATTFLKRVSSDSETLEYIERTRKHAHELQIRNWTITWQHPQVMKNCTNTLFCASFDHSFIIAEYRIHSEELRKLAHQVIKKVAAARGGTLNKNEKALLKQADEQHRFNMELADTVPQTTSDCG